MASIAAAAAALALPSTFASSSRVAVSRASPSSVQLSTFECLRADGLMSSSNTLWQSSVDASSTPNFPRLTVRVRAKPQRQKEDDDEDVFFPEAEEIDREALQAFLDLELQTDYDLDDARHYEIMFLVPEKEVEKVPDVIKKVEAFVAEQKGKIWRVNDWGLRKLAYKIKKAERANYVLMNIEMKAAAINQLNTMFEKDERVIRHMCISQKEAQVEDSVPPPNYYSEAAEGEEEDDSDYEDEDEGKEDEEEKREWDQVVQGQESSAAL